MEQGYLEALKESIESENKEMEDVDDRVPLTKDLTAIVEKIVKIKGVHESIREEQQIALQKIPNSSVAVFQSIQSCEDKQKENMKVQVSVHFVLKLLPCASSRNQMQNFLVHIHLLNH